jgi:polyisoprenoid-binding protein YceI
METATLTKTKWSLDPAHSEIGFKVKHMMITNVSGSFGKFDVQAETEGDDFTKSSIVFTADLTTLSTNSTDRDNHLKSADFFDAANHPTLKFTSTKLEKKDDENYILHGNLTIRDVTKPIKLDVEFGGIGKDPWGNQKAGFTLSGKLNRADFGLTWNAALETGGVLVSEEVKLFGEIQLVKQAQ